MKKYKINTAYPVNARASKNGVKWEYSGKKTFEEAQEKKERFEKNMDQIRKNREAGYCVMIGLRITDAETGEIVYERIV